MKKAFVIGHPIAHSRSPLIHGYWLNKYGIEGSYERIDVAPGQLVSFIRTLEANGFGGGNVTIPHKQAVMPLCFHVDANARAIAAVNTLELKGSKLFGYNTDGIGFLSNLDQRIPDWKVACATKHALVLGAGGAARAVVHALSEAGFRIAVVNRTFDTAQALALAFDKHAAARRWSEIRGLMADVDLLVNTTSLGMKGQPALDIDLSPLPKGAIVNDLVYVPLETELLRRARERGLTAVDGLGMLLHQAVPGFERWFGVRPEVTDELCGLVAANIGACS